ncbi:MAG: TatD family hydrolase [Saprospiraceae bacterium]
MINLHTHHPTFSDSLLEIESVYYEQQKVPRSTTRSIGLHPWHLEGINLDEATSWLREQALLPSTVAIGEAGLDKVCNTPWNFQVSAFQRCVEVSEKMEKPLIIHCVRAFSEIIALKKEWEPRQFWIFHGFNKNPAVVELLLKAECFLSFGTALLRTQTQLAESFLAVPEDRFFLETDDANISISAVYGRAAELRGIALNKLEKMVARNFSNAFKRSIAV